MSSILNNLFRAIQAQGSQVEINENILDGDRLPNIWQRFLKTNELNISNVTLNNQDANKSFSLTGKLDFLSLKKKDVKISFFDGQNEVTSPEMNTECLIEVVNQIPTWKVSDDFNELPQYLNYKSTQINNGKVDSFLGKISFKNVGFYFSSFDFSDIDGKVKNHNFRGSYLIGNDLFSQGINFIGSISTKNNIWSIVKTIHSTLPDNIQVISKIEGASKSLLSFDATFYITGVKYAPVPSFSLALKKLFIRSGLSSKSLIGPQFGFECVIDDKLDVDILMDIGSKQVKIIGEAEDDQIFAFKDLAKLIGVPSSKLQSALPENKTASYFGKLGLKQIEIDFTISPAKVDEISVAVSTEKPWEFFDDKIELTPLLYFKVLNPADTTNREINLDIVGLWKINNTHFQTYVSPVRKVVAAEMMAGEVLDVKEVFKVWMPGIKAPAVELNEMFFSANFESKAYTVQLGAAQTMPFDLGLTSLQINNIQFFAEFGSGNNSSWKFNGEITLGIFNIEIDASHTGNNWNFRGGVSTIDEISLEKVFGHLLNDLHPGKEQRMPEAIPTKYATARILSLYVEYNSTPSSFKAFLDLELKIDITEHLSFEELIISLEFDKQGFNNGFIEAKLFLEKVEITLRTSKKVNEGIVFEGTSAPGKKLPLGELLGEFAQKFKLANNNFPKPLKELTVENIHVRYDSKTKDFTFSIETKFPIDGKELDAVIDIEITHNNKKYTRKFSGIVKVGNLEFDLIFQQEQNADTIFLAAYENRAGGDQNIQSLVKAISNDSNFIAAAKDIKFNLKDALLVIDKKPTGTKVLFGLDIGGGLDISKLPLVGKMFPTNSKIKVAFQPLITSSGFSNENDFKKIRLLVPTGGFKLPENDVAKGIGFNIKFEIGQESYNLNLPIGVNEVKKQKATTPVPSSSTNSSETTTGSPPSASGNIKWFNVGKKLGPVEFGKVGVQYEKGEITILLNASLALAGLTISVDGLYASSKLKPIHPTFGLHGLGIDYKKGPLEIGGAFLRSTNTDKSGNTYDSYDGIAVIKTKAFSLSAIGSYAYYKGHPSLFIYAFLNIPIGGPAFFFVTGLAAGFGYNRRIVVPSLEGVRTFPLVAEAISGKSKGKNNLSKEIENLHEVIPPSVGDYFLAVGVRFSSFKIIDSFILLTVSFGTEFEVDVLGLSTLVIPTPDTGSSIEPLAEIQLALKAVFNPDRGFLKVRAGLTSQSFLLSRNCHLTGGFAFYVWFKDNPEDQAKAGEFVLTIGGYHPRYTPPKHYPKVAPLGFNWQVTREVAIKGDFYFALVPTAVMAGGHLSATYTSGNLKAWFKIGADFIISWKPYFYDAEMYLDMGVSYTFHFFGTHHISVNVGADLHIWGPKFSGKAKVHLWIVSFTVKFGAHTSLTPSAIDWAEFKKSFLPENDKWVSVSVSKGLVKKLGTEKQPIYVVNPKELCLEANSALPITASKNSTLAGAEKDIYIGSMKINGATANDKVNTKFDITVKKGTTPVNSKFSFTPILKNVPGALWDKKFKHDPNENPKDALVENACMGFSIKVKDEPTGGQSKIIDTKPLLNDVIEFEKETTFETYEKFNSKFLKTKGVKKITKKSIEVKDKERNELLNSIGFKEVFQPRKELIDELILTV